MADSVLAAKIKTSPPNGGPVWDRLEAAVEVLYDVISTVSVPDRAIADGGDITQGAKADAATTDSTATSTVVSILKGILSLTGKDSGFATTTSRGVLGVPFTSADQHSAVASVSDAPTSGQKLVITDLVVSVDTAMSVTFKCETSGAVICGPFYMAANTTINPLMRGGKRKLATADKKLQVLTSFSGNISVEAAYYSEA